MLRFFSALAFLCFIINGALAQIDNNTLSYEESLYEGVQWRSIGPYRGGRAGTVSGVIGNNNLYYMGTAGGGVWKTEDAGNTWQCISDGYFGGSIGAVAVSESDPNVLYVGEGEQTLRGNVSSGKGVWKSTDGGESWSFLGLKESEHISRIRIHPTNPDIVYVAAIGNLWKDNEQRGVFKSIDGGKTWEKVLYVSDQAGAGDLIIDPNDPNTLYTASWQMKRSGYRMDSGGPDSKLFVSKDGGANWTDITKNSGLPGGPWGIVGIAVSPVNSQRIWTIIEAEEGGVYRSDDGAKTWKKVNENRALRQRAWYYSRITADTQDENKVYVMNVSYGVSTDGGETFTLKNAPHGDHHDLWIDPSNNQRMAIADDGGAQVSNDGGTNWTTYHNQPTAQFYRVTTDDVFPYRIYGAQQDNSSIRIQHRTSAGDINERHWEPSAGGESAHLAPDPTNPDIVYGGTYKGYMMRLDHSTGQIRSTNVWPDNPAGSGVEVMKYRFNWNYPVFFSPHDPKKLYAGSNMLHVSTNGGQSWEVISPDLTRGEPETLKSSGGPITQDNTGVEFYGTIFAGEESEQEEGVIWIGSDDGLVHVTKDGGKTWKNVTPPMSPKQNMINCIDVNPHKNGSAYVAATSYKFGDYTPYLYKTDDYGETWELITNGIKSTDYTRAIRADLSRPGLLYAGTEWGMYVSFDDGASWKNFNLNLPIVSIRDLALKNNDLIAATHGRSFWIIDDLTPLHQLSDEIANADHHLYKPKDSYRMQSSNRRSGKSVGQNHPNGVIFNYFIKDLKETDEVALHIMEMDGDTIQTFSNTTENKKAMLKPNSGGNTFVWNMRYPGFKEFEGMIFYSSPNNGPKAVPGTYRSVLTLNGEPVEQEFEIIKDPRLPNTATDYQKQFDYLISVRDKVSVANEAVIRIRKTRDILNNIREEVKAKESTKKVMQLVQELDDEMTVIENNIHMTKNQSYQDPLNFGIRINNRIAFLMADQQRGDYPPTDQAVAFRDEVFEELDKELLDLNTLLNEKVEAINKELSQLGISMMN